jgi:hypothetical protein
VAGLEPAHQEPERRERDTFEPMTAEEAQKWILEGEVELLNDVFGEPPEAAAELTTQASAGSAIFLLSFRPFLRQSELKRER